MSNEWEESHHELNETTTMLTIRLSKAQWAKAWRAMIEVAPVRLIRDDPVYEVLPAHLEVLAARGFTFEVVPEPTRRVD